MVGMLRQTDLDDDRQAQKSGARALRVKFKCLSKAVNISLLSRNSVPVMKVDTLLTKLRRRSITRVTEHTIRPMTRHTNTKNPLAAIARTTAGQRARLNTTLVNMPHTLAPQMDI